MATHQFSASALIHAPAQDIYAIFADYHEGHPHILPKPPFVSLTVEQGGTGAGTVIRLQMRMLGQLQTLRGVVSEPDPGRILAETYDNGYITSFTVEPRGDGQQSYVTIATELSGRAGVLGALEGWFVARLLRPVYVRELAQVAAFVAARAV
jgi:hypothetical protein